MTDNNRSRSGSLQFYPRVRSKKIIPRVNWKPINKTEIGLMGFLGYKVSMTTAWVKDLTPDSLTKGKRISIPATIIECPPMKIYSVRFYKNGKIFKDVLVSNDKNLKRRLKIPKKIGDIDSVKDFDDIRAILSSGISLTKIGKKKVDLIEVGLSGKIEEKFNFIKENIGKDIHVGDIYKNGLVDVRAVTKGYGTQGPVKRFGISLKSHKSEKGRRRPGSLAPWHPARVTFRAPQAGQTGYHKRITYNNLILEVGKIHDKDINKKGGFNHYGDIKTDYIILSGSIPGPKKRGIVITPAIRPRIQLEKRNYEVIELR